MDTGFLEGLGGMIGSDNAAPARESRRHIRPGRDHDRDAKREPLEGHT